MENLEVRLFGPMTVRRPDGSIVGAGEWRTNKTMDLMRLLALDAGQPVTISSLLDRLWPDVDAEHGRASLRTAASQLRKILQVDCLERRPGSLVLHRSWVDAQAYASLVVDVGQARRSGDFAELVTLVREAEALYVDDIEVHETPGDWLEEVQGSWREYRFRMLLEAADAAAAINWIRNSHDFAEQAYRLDRHSEHAGRAFMRALAGLGEMDKALSVYERMRRDLAEQFGVDPSPQTRALHLQLLTGTVDRHVERGLAGNEATVEVLVTALGRIRRSEDGRGLVWLCGEQGSGRDSVVEAACRQLGLTVRNMNRDSAWIPRQPLDSTRDLSGPATDVVVMPRAEFVPPHAYAVLVALARKHGATIVVPMERRLWNVEEVEADAWIAMETIEVPPLTGAGLARLARAVLQGEPAKALLRELHAASSGLAGAACSVLRGWLDEGRVIWTAAGLDLRSLEEEQVAPPAGMLRRSLRLVHSHAVDVLSVVAVAGMDVTEVDVRAVMTAWYPAQSRDVAELLDGLVGRGLLRVTPAGFRLRERDGRQELLDWMRPGVRQRLHCLVAETLTLDPPSRVRHWLAGGRHQLACDAGVAALNQAVEVDDRELAEELLEVLATLPPSMRAVSDRQPVGLQLATMTALIQADEQMVLESREPLTVGAGLR